MQDKLPVGVYHLPRLNKYKVVLTRQNKAYYFGLFDTSQSAIVKLNEVLSIGPENVKQPQSHKIKPRDATGYLPKGISWSERDGRYNVRVSIDNRQVQIGSSRHLESAKQILEEHKNV